MAKILARKSTLPTARAIREYLLEKTGIKYFITTDAGDVKDILLRVGNSDISPAKSDSNLNAANVITYCSNKLLFSQKFADIIPAPGYTLLGRHRPQEFPVVVRETLSSYGGKGIHMVENQEQMDAIVNPKFYWTPFVKTSNEFRVHVVGGIPVKVMKKLPMDLDVEEAAMPIRNVENGYHFQNVEKFLGFKKMMDVTQKVVDVLGKRSWFALDIAFSPKHDNYFVFEANSSPSLAENADTLALYMTYIMKELNLGK